MAIERERMDDAEFAGLKAVLKAWDKERIAAGGPPTISRESLTACAWAICEEYLRQDMDLTLRQLYYQFVGRGLIPNGDKAYKRLGDTLANARVAGEFPMHYIVDRGRHVGLTGLTDQTDPDDGLRNISREVRTGPQRWLWRSRWYGQPIWPSVWIEKEALAGVFAPTCETLGVGLFACKGYPSVTALFDWLKEAAAAVDDGTHHCVVLYCGDHDPDGLEIPESCERTLNTMLRNGLIPGDGEDTVQIEFRRIALTREQIEEYNPPPFPAKTTSARYASYVERTGLTDAWELDALTPTVLRDLITEEVEALFDPEVGDDNDRAVGAARTALRSRMDADWLAKVLR